MDRRWVVFLMFLPVIATVAVLLLVLFIVVPLILRMAGVKDEEALKVWRKARAIVAVLIVIVALVRCVMMAGLNETPQKQIDRSAVDAQMDRAFHK